MGGLGQGFASSFGGGMAGGAMGGGGMGGGMGGMGLGGALSDTMLNRFAYGAPTTMFPMSEPMAPGTDPEAAAYAQRTPMAGMSAPFTRGQRAVSPLMQRLLYMYMLGGGIPGMGG